MAKKKGKIERSIHYFDIDLQRIGNSGEDSFVSYKNQAARMFIVAQLSRQKSKIFIMN